MEVELTVRVHFEDGAYWAEVVELPGCFASGESLERLKDALDEAIPMYLGNRAVALRVDEMKVLVPTE